MAAMDLPINIDEALKVESVQVVSGVAFDNLKVLLTWLASQVKDQGARLASAEESCKGGASKDELQKLLGAVEDGKAKQAAAEAKAKVLEARVETAEKSLLENASSKAAEPPESVDFARRISALEDAEKKRQSAEAQEGPRSQSQRRSSNGKAGESQSSASDAGPKSTDNTSDGELRTGLERVAKLAEESGARVAAAEEELKRIAAQVAQQGAAQTGQAERIKDHAAAIEAADRKLGRQIEDLQALRGTCEGLRKDLDSKPLPIPPPAAAGGGEGDPSGMAAVLGEMQRRLDRKADVGSVENLQRGLERAEADVAKAEAAVAKMGADVAKAAAGMAKMEADVAKVDSTLREVQGRVAEIGAKEVERPVPPVRPSSAVRFKDGVSRVEYDKLEIDVDALTERVADLEVARAQADDADAAGKCQRMEDGLKLLLKRVDDLGVSKAERAPLDDLAFKVAALEIPVESDGPQASTVPLLAPAAAPALSAAPLVPTEAPRPLSAKRRPSSGNSGLNALREMVVGKADREEVRQLAAAVDSQRNELLAELRALRNRLPTSPDAPDAGTFSVCTHLQEDLNALRRLVQTKADASDMVVRTPRNGTDVAGQGALNSADVAAQRALTSVNVAAPGALNSADVAAQEAVTNANVAAQGGLNGADAAARPALDGPTRRPVSARRDVNLAGVDVMINGRTPGSANATYIGSGKEAEEIRVRVGELTARLDQLQDVLLNKANMADVAHLQEEFDTLRGSTRRLERRTSLINRLSNNGNSPRGAIGRRSTNDADDGGDDMRKALRDQQKLIQQLYKHVGLLGKGVVIMSGNDPQRPATPGKDRAEEGVQNGATGRNSGSPGRPKSGRESPHSDRPISYEDIMRFYEELLATDHVAPKENVSRVANLGGDVNAIVRRMDEYDQLLSSLRDEVLNKAGRADLQKLARLVQDYLSRTPEGDYAMLAGKPLTGYKCMSCDHPLERLNSKRADHVPGGSLPKSNWALASAERIYAGGMQGKAPGEYSPMSSPRLASPRSENRSIISPISKAGASTQASISSQLSLESLPPLKERKSSSGPGSATPRRPSSATRRPQTASQENSQISGPIDAPLSYS